jgi:hypothetical protein
MRKVEYVKERAEGRCCGIPYNTELVSSNGVRFHLWLGDRDMSTDLSARLNQEARRQRDIVSMTWCPGEPTGFWANEDFGEPA